MSITGVWNLKIVTPLGTQSVVLEVVEHDSAIEGTAKSAAETTPLIDPFLDGNRLRWEQKVTRPMRLHLVFDVVIDGDNIKGSAKAGKLPASNVSGTRASS